ncbi:MAG: ATP-binding protein [Chloroflexota bacterium]
METTYTLDTLLAQKEGQYLAYIRSKFRIDELAQTMVAMANAQGGMVVVGVTGRHKIEGVSDASATRDAILDAALSCTPPLILPLPQIAEHNGTNLLLITIPAGLSHVYSLHGKYLYRRGTQDEPIPPDALRRLLLERGETSWERLVPDNATQSELNQQKITTYVQRVGAAAETDSNAFLMRRGCLAQRDHAYEPTNAGLLLFGNDVERFFPQCEVTLVRYRGREMSDEFLREDIRDTLVETVRRAEMWLSENMRRGSRMIGLERKDWVQFPLGAVREVLVNAIAHRDYSIRGEGIRIALYADRLECYSPGRLPGHVTVHNIVEERFSRNESLVQVLADYGLIERLGYGIDRMLKQMTEAGLPKPEFRETAAGFLVTLQGHIGDDKTDVGGVDISEWQKMGLNERQIAALLHMVEHRRITNRELQDMSPDVSPETIRRDFSDLVERGLLLRVGEKRGTYYILK